MGKKFDMTSGHSGSVGGTIMDIGVGESIGNSGEKLDLPEDGEGVKKKGGLSFAMASFFMVAQMAGAGFLALPKSLVDAGWAGIILITVFCYSVCFSAIRLGRCYNILEERWPEYKEPSRQPYMEIAFRALGIWGRRLCLFCVMVTLIGSTIVFIILIATMMTDLVPYFNKCQWVCIVGACVLPTTWLGTPKDFWQASVLAVVSTVVCVVVILVEIVFEYGGNTTHEAAVHPTPTWVTFPLGFGAILFAFGGASVFPTIQNDMKNRVHFWKAAVLSFAVIFSMYAPVAIIGYYLIGDAVQSNILLSVSPSVAVTAAISLEIINLLGTFIISFNPVAQSIEDIIGAPSNFCWQRIAIRSGIIVLEVIVALAIPDFGKILNLIGGSTITCLSFVFPPLMYMKLVDNREDKTWPERTLPKWERVYLWVILLVGVIGGICSTGTSLMEILNPDSFGQSCFVHFNGEGR